MKRQTVNQFQGLRVSKGRFSSILDSEFWILDSERSEEDTKWT
jgi:hypothetical protein